MTRARNALNLAAKSSGVCGMRSIFLHALGGALLHKAKHVTGDPSYLYFLRSLGDAIAAMVTIDVFEGFVSRIAKTAVHLHRAIRCVTTQPVRDVIAHRHFVRYRKRAVFVHHPRGLVN